MKMNLLPLCFISVTALAAEWRAGVAAIDITPTEPVWMSGYAARTKPSEGVLQPLNAKYPPRVVEREAVAGVYAAVSVMRRVG